MAEPTPLEISKLIVQEIAKRGDEAPENFIYKEGFPEAMDVPELWTDILLIDLSLLSSSSTPAAARDHELAKLRSALSHWGCFQMKNHGMTSSFLEEVIEVSKQYFALPLEEKLKCFTTEDFQGYGNDQLVPKFTTFSRTVNWNDRLYLTLLPEENRKLELWPHKPDKLREILDEYSKKLETTVKEIYKAMAISLNLEEDCLLNNQGKQISMGGRINMYPRYHNPEKVLGVKPHRDGGTMTVLLQENEVEGLQIQKDDQWFKVPAIPGTLFINLGDFGEAMTNGIFKSAIHRVVVNSEKDRTTVASFCSPENTDEIGPLSELVGNHRPQVYNKFSVHQYQEAYYDTFGTDRRTLDVFKLI